MIIGASLFVPFCLTYSIVREARLCYESYISLFLLSVPMNVNCFDYRVAEKPEETPGIEHRSSEKCRSFTHKARAPRILFRGRLWGLEVSSLASSQHLFYPNINSCPLIIFNQQNYILNSIVLFMVKYISCLFLNLHKM